ncbi:hypothetical protein Taro_035630, partial [Colocasia esculenta]|nr:hypothetical protein [Colocasia esculenta]
LNVVHIKVQKPGDRDRIGRPKTDPTRRSRPRLGRAGPSPDEPGVGGSAHYTGVYLIQAEFRPSPLRFQSGIGLDSAHDKVEADRPGSGRSKADRAGLGEPAEPSRAGPIRVQGPARLPGLGSGGPKPSQLG